MNAVKTIQPRLVCDCGAKARNTSRERNRFTRRHPKLCSEWRSFAKQLAQDVRSVNADAPEVSE